ncbi:DUF861 domain-containing protein [Mycobacterium sp. CBMA293]|nr:DUF861 domain-containing protein [Mycolicibacterium sp. CBMA 360]MUL62708.1 DUF861 domain-containing protein [Mycolicibacterium sp. CBMA 335]MUL70744.1 DUF861 domain-containing protein [Mycolicibacterium sp. CBMA 311]MUL97232.1 DUF861 domain-containing protein [Mycolicibacterium sp. CBMA 230]MUM07981.1 hypothetical protein [Mycolicibacterium sp. CBMA 213]MUM15189.1 DUF861 domain-containing protein [Mycolicibacterium sp. CBMA 293]
MKGSAMNVAAGQFRLEDAVLEPFELGPDALISGDPKLEIVALHRTADGTVLAGLFRSTPGEYYVSTPGDEVTLVRKGRLIITADDGSVVDVRSGDVYTLAKGVRYTFKVVEDLEDYFVSSNIDGPAS